MKKMYQKPMTEVMSVMMESQILSGSPAPAPGPAAGVSASRGNYGNGGDQTW